MKIFLSYSSNNRRQVNTLADDLKAMGHAVWFDTEIGWGHDWWNKILDEILSCDLFVFALTSSSLKSTACKREREYASALKKRILPVRLAEVVMEALPSELQVLQTKPYDRADKIQALALAKAIFELRAADNLPDPLPTRPENPMPFASLADTLQSDTLHLSQQATLLTEIKLTLQEPKNARTAWEFLDRLSARLDVTASVKEEIAALEGRRERDLQAYRRTRWFEPRIFERHGKKVTDVVFMPNSHQLLTASSDFTVQLWDCETGEELQQFFHPASVISIAAYDHDNFITLCDDDLLRMCNLKTKVFTVLAVGTTSTMSLDVHPPIKRALIVSQDDDHTAVIQVWDTEDPHLISELKLKHTVVNTASIGPNSDLVVIAQHRAAGSRLLLWSIGEAQIRSEIRLPDSPNHIVFSPDGTWILVSFGNRSARTYNLQTGQPHPVFAGAPSKAAIDISSHERTLIATSNHSYNPITVYDEASGRELLQCRSSKFGLPTRVRFSPDGRHIAAAIDGYAQIWPVDL